MSRARWTTGVGIAVGGVGGALAALMGAPKAPRTAQAPAPHTAVATATQAALPASAASSVEAVLPEASAAPATEIPSSTSAPAPTAVVSASAAPATSAPGVATASPLAPPALELPQTREGLLKAEMLCDQKQDFDECARAAEALEKGTSGPPDPDQGRRFRRIALTHLVAQCEAGAPHPCFVLAAKYRAGAELAPSPVRAEALEQRGLELCKKRSAPECPPP